MKRQKEFVRGGPVCDMPILLDLCEGTQSVGKCIDLDEWQYVTKEKRREEKRREEKRRERLSASI